MRILLADGDQNSAKELRSSLAKLCFDIELVDSAKAAINSAEAEPPQLIVMDVALPDENGYLVCKKFRASKKTAKVPVILTSSADSAEADFKKHEKLKHKANAYFAKPIDTINFFDEVDSLIGLPDYNPEKAALLPEAIEPAPEIDMVPVEDEGPSKDQLNEEIESLKQQLKEQNDLLDQTKETSEGRIQELTSKLEESEATQGKLQGAEGALKAEMKALSKELEKQKSAWEEEKGQIEKKHKKAMDTLRDFYKPRVEKLTSIEQNLAELKEKSAKYKKEADLASAAAEKFKDDLEKERAFREKIERALGKTPD